MSELNENEKFTMTHISRFGSDGYPIAKRGGKWWIDGILGCGEFPVPFKTKREAAAQWEAYHQTLIDRQAGRL